MKQLALEEKIAAKNEARQEQEQQLEQQEIPEILLENKEIVDESEEYDLSAAPTPYNLEKVATTAQVMPNTGAETWILIFSTLFINSFLYFSRRKKLA